MAVVQILIKLLLGAFATCVLGWDILLLFFAEIGRRDDLRRTTSKTPPPFRFAIIVTMLDEIEKPALNQLINTLLNQNPSLGSPVDGMSRHPDIYVVSPTAVHEPLITISHTFPEMVHFIPYPAEQSSQVDRCNETLGKMHAWAVERLLAIGGNTRLFVFLEATDIVKPDYLQQIALKAAYYPVMQGYLAMKKLGEDMTSRNIGLKQRLLNRIEQAGRFHLGLSAALQPTGWSIHQDVLEKVPMDRFLMDYPKAYGLVLNRVGYRVHWAPNMVTYKDENLSFWQYMQTECLAISSRCRLFLSQLPATIQFAIVRRQPLVVLNQLWDILPLPNGYMGFVMLLLWGSTLSTPYSGFIGSVFFTYIVLQVAKLFVARIRFQDALFCSGLVVWYRLVSLAVMPFLVLSMIFKDVLAPLLALNTTAYGNRKTGLFNLSETTRKLQLPNVSLADEAWANKVQVDPVVQPVNKPLAKPSITAQLSNGEKILDCLIVINEHESQYQLQLSYKGNTFSTGYYPDQDDAFEALQEKLTQKGFTILFDTPQLSSI